MRDVNMGTIRSIDRAIDILQAFTIERSLLNVDELAKITAIPNSTVYRILCTLERRGLVQFDEKLAAYKPGLQLMSFGSLISSVLDIRQVAEELLIDLQLKTSQTVLMAVEDGDQIIYIFKKENYEGLKFSSVEGQRRPFTYGVLGPALLAFLPENRIERILSISPSPHVRYQPIDEATMRQRLIQIRQDQFYIESNETNLGVTGIGSPIFGTNGEVIAAIGVIGPAIQLDHQLERVKPILLETAQRISAKMGYKEMTRNYKIGKGNR